MKRNGLLFIVCVLLCGTVWAQPRPESIEPQSRDIAMGLSGGEQAAPAERRKRWPEYNRNVTGSAVKQGLIPAWSIK